jgi:hypothetical protein
VAVFTLEDSGLGSVGVVSQDIRGGGLSVTLSVRPARVGVFVPVMRGISWQKLMELAVATQARMWGGSGNLVFPLTRDAFERQLFWELADRFDADSWAVYEVTHGDLETLAPHWHKRETKRVVRQLVKMKTPKEARAEFLEQRRSTTAVRIEPTEEQQELLTRRLAPLHHDTDGVSVLETSTAFWEPQGPGLTSLRSTNSLDLSTTSRPRAVRRFPCY